MTARRLAAHAVLLAALAVVPAVAIAAPSIVVVPARPWDPSLPHLAWSGRTITLKAVARGLPTDATPVTFGWDLNQDGLFTSGETQTIAPAARASGSADLALTMIAPEVPVGADRYPFVYTVQLQVGAQVFYASYRVTIDATIPRQLGGSAASIPAVGATPTQLAIMREVALDEALWFLHRSITGKSGAGAQIVGALPTAPSTNTNAQALLALEAAGRLPAFPPGTMTWPDGTREAANDQRWNLDPYAEDAARLFNGAAAVLAPIGTDAAAEADDLSTPLPGTNDGVGLWKTQTNQTADILGALAGSGLGGVALPVGNASYVQGKPLEVVVQQIVDAIAYAQVGAASNPQNLGGWGYSPAYTPVMAAENNHRAIFGGLDAAVRELGPRGVYVNERLRRRAASALRYLRMPSDGLSQWWLDACGGSAPGQLAETADAVLAGTFLGFDRSSATDSTFVVTDALGLTFTRGHGRQQLDGYLAALGAAWVSSQVGCIGYTTGLFFNDGGTNATPYLRTDGKGNLESIYAVANALTRVDPAALTSVGGHDWRLELSTYLVRNQDATVPVTASFGSFADQAWGYMTSQNFYAVPTLFGALALARLGGAESYCPASCSGHGTCASFTGVCTCDPGFVAGGCQYSRATTCSGNGDPAADGTCTCDAGWVGTACAYSRTATCSGNGDPAVDGTCACDAGADGAACTLCPAGTVRPAGVSACTACADGTVATVPGSIVCTPCDAGSTSTAAHDACVLCAGGTASVLGGTCETCGEGTFASLPGATSCAACAVGQTSASDRTACVDCPAGQFNPAAGSTCTECVPGTFAAGQGAATCADCEAGTAAPASGAAACTACDPGWVAPVGSTTCAACPPGTIPADGATCAACADGTFAPSSASTTCTPCEAGTWSTAGQNACTDCPAGWFGGAGGCSECPAGSAAAATGTTACEACVAGTAAAPGAAACTACGPGTWSAPSAETCDSCPAGRFAAGSGATACQVCAANTFSAAGASACAACPAGTASGPGAESCAAVPPPGDPAGGCGGCGTGSGAGAGTLLALLAALRPRAPRRRL